MHISHIGICTQWLLGVASTYTDMRKVGNMHNTGKSAVRYVCDECSTYYYYLS